MSPIHTVPAGTTCDVGIVNHHQNGDETVEVWLRDNRPAGPGSTYSQAVMAHNPAIYLRMDRIVDGYIYDSSGNNRHGQVTDPRPSRVGGLLPGSAFGMEFAGEGDSVTVPGEAGLVAVGYYFEFWLEVDEVPATDVVILGFPSRMLVYLRANGTIGVAVRLTNGSMNQSFINNWTYTLGQRHFVGLWTNMGEENSVPSRRCLMDGVNLSSTTGPGGSRIEAYGEQDFVVNPGAFKGRLDEVAVFTGWSWGQVESRHAAHYAARAGIEPAPNIGEWFLAKQDAVKAVADQVITVGGPGSSGPLSPGTEYDVALRYRKGLLYNPGASNTADPSSWPSPSRGTFTTTVDPAEILAAEWARTGADSERIRLEIRPLEGVEDQDIHVWRRPSGPGEWEQIGTVEGPHDGDTEYTDTTIEGETAYDYALSTGVGAVGPATRVWSGPAGRPTYSYQAVVGGGYLVGFTAGGPGLQTELHDAYDDNGSVQALALRATAAAGQTEVNSGTLTNVPPEGMSFIANLRHKATSFTVDDYGEFGISFNVTVPGSE